MSRVEKIKKENGELLAILIRKDSQTDELNFITPKDFSLQVGIHNKDKGSVIHAHKHKPYEKPIKIDSQEIFYVEYGKLQVDIFDKANKPFKSVLMEQGDLIILNSGHGIKFLEESRMIEVKQGPYRGREAEKEYIG